MPGADSAGHDVSVRLQDTGMLLASNHLAVNIFLTIFAPGNDTLIITNSYSRFSHKV